jgi:CubicO group peptidase (beta-lactamase class C family)
MALRKEELIKRLQPVVSSYFPAQGKVCLVIAIQSGNEHFFFTFHRDEKTARPPANENTIFEIGSTTMAFTSCLLADMVTKNEVRLTEPIKNLLPAGTMVPSYRNQEVTLLDLAHHSSALPRIPENFPATVIDPANPCRDYSVADLYAFLSTFTPRRPIGSRREYSNLGMGLLGHVLSQTAQQSYEEAIRKRVAQPLGLDDTAVTLTAEQQARCIGGHSLEGAPVSAWDMPVMVGAGGLRSTARDLLVFLRTHWARADSLQAALKICTSPSAKSGRPGPLAFRYGAALGLPVLALAALWGASLMPGEGAFFALFLVPGFVVALLGGFGPGLTAVSGTTAGAWLLWGETFNGPLHGAIGMLLVWLASSRHRELARRELLGWHRSATGLLGWGPPILWHSGETGGCASFIGLLTKEKAAAVVLANCAKPVASMGIKVLNALVGE